MLGDACSDFATKVAAAVEWLDAEADRYFEPPYISTYGRGEILALKLLCASVRANDSGARARLMRLADAIREFHDTPPSHDQEQELQRREQLIAVMTDSMAAVSPKVRQIFDEKLTREMASIDRALFSDETLPSSSTH